jgi:hypothetical protein
MQELRAKLDGLRRPPLLVHAARIGAGRYVRAIHLARLLGPGALPSPVAALAELLEMEAAEQAAREARAAGYRAARHVELLIALMAEARLCEEVPAAPPVQPKASGISDLRRAT